LAIIPLIMSLLAFCCPSSLHRFGCVPNIPPPAQPDRLRQRATIHSTSVFWGHPLKLAGSDGIVLHRLVRVELHDHGQGAEREAVEEPIRSGRRRQSAALPVAKEARFAAACQFWLLATSVWLTERSWSQVSTRRRPRSDVRSAGPLDEIHLGGFPDDGRRDGAVREGAPAALGGRGRDGLRGGRHGCGSGLDLRSGHAGGQEERGGREREPAGNVDVGVHRQGSFSSSRNLKHHFSIST
jgi:hypothetical protein